MRARSSRSRSTRRRCWYPRSRSSMCPARSAFSFPTARSQTSIPSPLASSIRTSRRSSRVCRKGSTSSPLARRRCAKATASRFQVRVQADAAAEAGAAAARPMQAELRAARRRPLRLRHHTRLRGTSRASNSRDSARAAREPRRRQAKDGGDEGLGGNKKLVIGDLVIW
jgi:hypothetical protein